MTKSSGRTKSSSTPSKAVGSKASAAAISRLTSDIKRLMTTALDGGKLMGEILSRQFIESNPILAMMYTFTYIYYSAKTYEIRQKTDGFTEKYKDLCKLSAEELFCKAPPADERSGKGSSTRNDKASRQNILADREQSASSGHGIPAAAQNGVSNVQNALTAALSDYNEIVDLLLKLRDPAVPHSLRKSREIAPLTDS